MTAKNEVSKGAGFPALKRLTPVLIVERVSTCLPFWVDRLGFEATTTVPGPDDTLVFAILHRSDMEIMYQSRASVLADGTVSEADVGGHSTVLFLEVESIDEVEKAIAGAPVVKPRHETFYGSTEIYVKEPGGNTVGFSQHG